MSLERLDLPCPTWPITETLRAFIRFGLPAFKVRFTSSVCFQSTNFFHFLYNHCGCSLYCHQGHRSHLFLCPSFPSEILCYSLAKDAFPTCLLILTLSHHMSTVKTRRLLVYSSWASKEAMKHTIFGSLSVPHFFPFS